MGRSISASLRSPDQDRLHFSKHEKTNLMYVSTGFQNRNNKTHGKKWRLLLGRIRKNMRSSSATMLVTIPVSTVSVINFWTRELVVSNMVLRLASKSC